MPGVIVQSGSSSTSLGFGSSHPSSSQNPFTPRAYDGLSVADIKQRARESVNKEARGVSAITLIKSARTQIISAREYEAKGDLKGALGTYMKAATLTKMAMDSPEYLQETRGKGVGGVIRKELNDLLETEGRDLNARTSAVEEKLKVIEKHHTKAFSDLDTKSVSTSKTIKDRLRALQDNGLSIEQQHSMTLRDIQTPPTSPRNQLGHQPNNLPSPPSLIPSTSTSSTTVSNRVFVSPLSLGPPSPPPSSSSLSGNATYLNTDDISDFNRAFPAIDVLDNDPVFLFPSVPTTPPIRNAKVKHLSKTNDASHPSELPISPMPSFRNIPVPIERPSSTPISHNPFANSRPPSPRSAVNNGLPYKNSAKVPLPVKNIASPKDLMAYIRDHAVLVIDVRHRADFDREHIKANAVICVEPSVLLREGLTTESLESAMVVGTRQENALFGNRDKFDLIAIYDTSSSTFPTGSELSPISVLVRLIFEQAFRRTLKRVPMLLVGGIDAWKREFGENELIRGPGYALEAEVQKSMPSGRNSLANGFANGINSSPNGSPIEDSVPTVKNGTQGGYQISLSLDQSGHSRSPADSVYSGSYMSSPDGTLTRRPAIVRQSLSSTKSFNDNGALVSPSIQNGIGAVPPISPISYPQFPRRISPHTSGSNSIPALISSSQSLQPTAFSSPPNHYDIPSPPLASINLSQSSSRKRSDFVDQSQEALSNFNSVRSPTGVANGTASGSIGNAIDYPELNSLPLVRPPPPVASPSLSERQDSRPRLQPSYIPPTNGVSMNGAPTPPRIKSDYPVSYWSDVAVTTSGLKNLGNTCYMNAPIQCLNATVPFSRFFTEHRWRSAINYMNQLGSKGRLTAAFAKLLHDMRGGDFPYLTPIDFRRSICSLNSQYRGSDQHDSQEFLSFLIDGIHEDLNRIIGKPPHTSTPEEETELDGLPPQVGSEREWKIWKSRNDSLIVDFFQGQFRNRLECLTCHKTSTTYNVFSILSLPIPHMKNGKVSIRRCLDDFFNEEVLEKDDAWDCPKCKTKVRATKKLSLARLPPVLMIHFKRFEANGRFSDKVDTFVDFPMKTLDLTSYMPPLLPSAADKSELSGGPPMSSDDPHSQLPPYQYDLYGVTNHYGNLSSGHYTAFVASRGRWLYCDDSSVKEVDPKQVVNQKAYVLFYKRVRR